MSRFIMVLLQDEADQLGDRIGIMHHGAMKVCGTALFLKRMFGVGYTMTFSKRDKGPAIALKQLIKNYVNEADILTDVGTELSFRLPLTASPTFPQLLGDIDDKM